MDQSAVTTEYRSKGFGGYPHVADIVLTGHGSNSSRHPFTPVLDKRGQDPPVFFTFNPVQSIGRSHALPFYPPMVFLQFPGQLR